jgi:hypothetical protein
LSFTFIFRKKFYSIISGLKIIGHGNPDNNLESHYILELYQLAEVQQFSTAIFEAPDDGHTGRNM